MNLRESIERYYDTPAGQLHKEEVRKLIDRFKEELNSGAIRSAEPCEGSWKVNTWVKKGILLAFRIAAVQPYGNPSPMQYFDKETMTLKQFATTDNVRIVPGGNAIRDGVYVGPGVVMMPPSYINIGAYVGEGTMVDSHALIGSCAQVGKHVHLSAAAQIGGVLEPIGSMPVIIEDDVLIGGNCGIYEGAIVKRRAVIGAGVILTGSTPVYDIVHNKIYRRTDSEPLCIPENAVVIPGARAINNSFAKEHQLSLYTPVIVKYRDEKTDAATVLEQSLREDVP
ncbi:MAG: 2,3,4,5-tetrahydropyridine-2,6-dicarboxylate N-succinyltransferase [Bacteroidota bacterium]